MKNFDKIMSSIDPVVEKKIMPFWAIIQRHFSIISATLLLALMTLFLFRVFSDRSYVLVATMRDDFAHIEQVLMTIDKECNILNIHSDRGFLDFFTVEKFTGSTVGCLNLAYPKNWRGPYMQQNPTIQQKCYEIVQAKDGYFVIPGKGVKLPNGLTVGADIIITAKTLVGPMLRPGGRLFYKSQALGVHLNFIVGDWDTPRPDKKSVDNINEILQEFNEALPYAQRSDSQELSGKYQV